MDRVRSYRWKLLLFTVLSLADLGLTWHLLVRYGGDVSESNPVARWWLDTHGWAGLVAFKAAVVTAAAVLCGLLCLLRPRVGASILAFGCTVLAGVVLYSSCLPLVVHARSQETAALEAALAEQSRRMDQEIEQGFAYRAVLAALCSELQTGRCTLADAVARLEQTAKGKNPAWRAHLRRVFDCGSDQEALAVSLVQWALLCCWQECPSLTRGLARRLEREFQATYGRPLPVTIRQHLPTLAIEPTEDCDTSSPEPTAHLTPA